MGTTWRNVTEQPLIRILLLGAVLLGIAVGAGLILTGPTLPFATASPPEILKGDFTAATPSGLFAFTGCD